MRNVTIDDFKYVGSVYLPKKVLGLSTAYAAGMLARKPNPVRFYSDTHIGSGGGIYEFTIPSLRADKVGQAKLTWQIGDIYNNKKLDAQNKPVGGENGHLVSGLRHDRGSRFYWSYGANYSPEGGNDPSYGISDLSTLNPTAVGPYGDDMKINKLWRRGGTLRIPQWFKQLVNADNTLAVGFGGYYSIIDGGSAGPCLAIRNFHKPTTVLLGYPWSGTKDHSQHCPRPNDYTMVGNGTWMGQNGGTWTAADQIGGDTHSSGAVWIDLDDINGFVVWCSQGVGKISYDNGGVQVKNRVNRVYSYDPVDLAAVGRGYDEAWKPRPDIYDWKIPGGFTGRVCGVVFDKPNRRLYTLVTEAYEHEGEWYPIIQAYKI